MQTRILAERADALDERDLVSYLALGLVAASQWLDAELARHGRAEPGRGDGAAGGGEPALHCVLGLIAVRQRAVAALAAARRPAAPEPAPPPPPRRELRGLLR